MKEEIPKLKDMEKLIETNIKYLCEHCSRPIFIIQGEKHCLYCRGVKDTLKKLKYGALCQVCGAEKEGNLSDMCGKCLEEE